MSACAGSLDVGTVEAYHELFFDVHPRLCATDWIMSRAIGASYWTGFTGKPLGCLWKYLGYVGGPLALELVIAVTTGEKLPPVNSSAISTASDLARQEAYLRTLCGLAVAVLTEDAPRGWPNWSACTLDLRVSTAASRAPPTNRLICFLSCRDSLACSLAPGCRRRKAVLWGKVEEVRVDRTWH